MKSVLVVYGTTGGQTRRIAAFITDALRTHGAKVELVDSAGEDAAQVQPVHSATIVCGTVHRHRHHAALMRFVKQNRAWLTGLPAAFVCVSAAAQRQDEQGREEQRTIAEAFYRDTGWTPAITRHVVGAGRQAGRDDLRRSLMRLVAKPRDSEGDASRERENTDWDDVARFVDEFLAATSQGEGGH